MFTQLAYISDQSKHTESSLYPSYGYARPMVFSPGRQIFPYFRLLNQKRRKFGRCPSNEEERMGSRAEPQPEREEESGTRGFPPKGHRVLEGLNRIGSRRARNPLIDSDSASNATRARVLDNRVNAVLALLHNRSPLIAMSLFKYWKPSMNKPPLLKGSFSLYIEEFSSFDKLRHDCFVCDEIWKS